MCLQVYLRGVLILRTLPNCYGINKELHPIIVTCANLCLPYASSASYYATLCWGQFNKALHISTL